MPINYVRFQRGPLSAYNKLIEQDQLNENTLYFIYADDDDSVISLYMGDKLISSGDPSSEEGAKALKDLSDVDISNAELNSFLVQDENGKWIAKTPIEIAALIQEHLESVEVINLEGDNSSIEVVNNVIQLKNYGTNYYKFIPAVKDDSGNIIEESKYELTEGFIEGLEPKVDLIEDTLVLNWYEPNTEEIDNLKADLEVVKDSIADNATAIENVIKDIEELNDSLNAEDGIINQIKDLENQIGNSSSDVESASGIYKEIEDLSNTVETKADKDSVYTKENTDKAIAAAIAGADHLKRTIVDSVEAINKDAADALTYIYMVPTGLQYEDDKYDEYVVIEVTIDDEVSRVVEKVGSWEVNLDNYATKDQIIIDSVSNDFTINENKQLLLNELSINKVTNLQNILNSKVDAQEGYTLLSALDKQKLDKLSLDEESGDLGVSGTINAANVQGLAEWLNAHASTTPGLSENNLTDDLYNKLKNSLFITSVETTQLNVTDGHLSIIEVDQSKITGLVEALNSKASTAELTQVVTDFTSRLNDYVLKSDYETDIAEIRDILTWKTMQ